ncbi:MULTISPECIES: GNAT family N-acetyltransferase [unclassified Pseudoalteromonas]|uniref:GNAT family N-acetyltransferase n=1 Tax=unclassified Pseudoalteromonas TaxID=194690 RepID=UPI000B3C2B90|nr:MULTISPECIES: GNAT family N-acetyltransferase [unclassified Pseudoalteromonas]MDN3378127.1 GNAT family N-acetyltransferase [Pseudoalteromonas sp. APC 3893]MDN3386892.1 GNAT family N-acetyltransferase [Pseudoalteromonas sp. APC 4017]OUS74598.1 GNAT family N-acetyltransferase [Pseudoalteromonas sp. A601]
MNLTVKPFSALTTNELFIIAKGRVDVFVVEQACAYPELDEVDCHSATRHVYWLTQQEQLGAYARCYVKNEQYSAIGRVLINESQRGSGFAKKLVKQAIAVCVEQWPSKDVYIGAQTYLLDFYRGFGFTAIAQPYLEDGIEHQDMILKNPSA